MRGICCYCNKPIADGEPYKNFHSECYDKYEEWANEQYDMVCPYCEYEFEEYEKIYEETEEDIECPCCGETFTVNVTITCEWRTYKREEDYKEQNNEL